MPNYDYKCEKCTHEFEVKMSLAQKDHGEKPACPLCQSQDTKQAFRSVMVNKLKSMDNCGAGLSGACGGHQCGLGCGH